MTELEEAYITLRKIPLPSDNIPASWKWFVITLLHDIDKRLTAVEKAQDDSGWSET